MSQYKSALHAPQPLNHQDDYKYRPQLVQLKEVFPSWSNDGIVFVSFHSIASHPLAYLT